VGVSQIVSAQASSPAEAALAALDLEAMAAEVAAELVDA
jgi:hypothetical protein